MVPRAQPTNREILFDTQYWTKQNTTKKEKEITINSQLQHPCFGCQRKSNKIFRIKKCKFSVLPRRLEFSMRFISKIFLPLEGQSMMLISSANWTARREKNRMCRKLISTLSFCLCLHALSVKVNFFAVPWRNSSY